MRKQNKIFSLIACSAVLAGAAVIGAANVNVAPVAAAEGTPVTFEVAQSAQVKFGDEGGIRFSATVSGDYLAGLNATKVVLKSSIDKVGGSTTQQTAEWVVFGEGSTYVSGYETNTYYHSISFGDAELEAQLKAAAAVELEATMWLEADGAIVEGSEQSVTRSMRAVANAVYDKVEENQTELNKYFGARKTAKKAFKEVGDATQGIADKDWVIDGGAIATAVYNGAAAVGDDLTAGDTATGSYALFDAEYNVYNVPAITYVTKVITGASDVEIFDLTLEKAGCANGEAQSTLTEWTVKGYYVLASNVDATGYVIKQEGSIKKNSGGKYFYSQATYGFAGTLEGNGYTLKVSVGDYGLFGSLTKGATIKNIGLDITVSSYFYNVNGSALLGYRTADAGADIKMEQVYIKAKYHEAYTGKNKGNMCLFHVMKNVQIRNVVVDWSEGYMFDPDARTSLLGKQSITSGSAGFSRCSIYVICSTKYTTADGVELPVPLIKTDAGVSYYAKNDNLGDGYETPLQNANFLYRADSAQEVTQHEKYGGLDWNYVDTDGDEILDTWKYVG